MLRMVALALPMAIVAVWVVVSCALMRRRWRPAGCACTPLRWLCRTRLWPRWRRSCVVGVPVVGSGRPPTVMGVMRRMVVVQPVMMVVTVGAVQRVMAVQPLLAVRLPRLPLECMGQRERNGLQSSSGRWRGWQGKGWAVVAEAAEVGVVVLMVVR